MMWLEIVTKRPKTLQTSNIYESLGELKGKKTMLKNTLQNINKCTTLKFCLFIEIKMSKVSLNFTLLYFDFIFSFSPKESFRCGTVLNIKTPPQIRISHLDFILLLKGNLTVDFIFPSKHFQLSYLTYLFVSSLQ